LGQGIGVVSERLAKHRASVLRPILELEKKGEPISGAIGDVNRPGIAGDI
jgi:putative transposase